ncbi:MAG: peptidylprolyl isomerase [Spirochaetales bacterium]|nr:MAG: peptidylprolyl isomerase [Spirochaetales bacterium]
MTVEQDKVVSIAYTLRDDSGEVIDSSDDQEDLAYLHGHQNIVEGLEQALTGKSGGDQVSTVVRPEQGYGTRDEELVFSVPRSNLPEGDLEEGMQFAAQDKDGNQQIVTVVSVADGKVALDGNHPLAGQNLHFDVRITDIRDALEIELSHGHVHDPNHHHHH